MNYSNEKTNKLISLRKANVFKKLMTDYQQNISVALEQTYSSKSNKTAYLLGLLETDDLSASFGLRKLTTILNSNLTEDSVRLIVNCAVRLLSSSDSQIVVAI